MKEIRNENQVLLYQTEDDKQRIEIHLQDETVWLSQKLMAEICSDHSPKHPYAPKNIFLR